MKSLKEIQLDNEQMSKSFIVPTVKANYTATLLPHVEKYISDLKKYFSRTNFMYTLKSGEIREWGTKKERFRVITNDLCIETIAWKTVIHSTLAPRTSLAQVVGKIYHEFGHETPRMSIESAADFIAVLRDSPLINIQYPIDAEEGVLMINSCITHDEALTEALSKIRHVLPMVVKPKKINHNKQSGYLSFDDGIFCAGKLHGFNVSLDHLNRLNGVGLTINKAAAKWLKPYESIPNNNRRAASLRLAQFEQFEEECSELYSEFEGKQFYLTHRFDERGRTYCRGYHMNYMGDDKRKAVIELAKKESINFY